jgi:hypothetical protein
MKSTEVYSQLRSQLAPWFKVAGFKRAKGRLSWSRSQVKSFVVVWCQISQSGWDANSGSQFTVEFQLAPEPEVGALQGRRQRLASFLSELEREEVRSIQNQVIASLPHPKSNHPILGISASVSALYLKQFKAVTSPYEQGHDIWFRYGSAQHVAQWAQFIQRKLPQCLSEIEAWG